MRHASRTEVAGRPAGRRAPGSYVVPRCGRGSVLGAEEAAALTELVNSATSLSAGTHRERFERRFAEYVGTRHALSVTSGTVALDLAMQLLDLAEGDEVITTPQTYQATVQPLLRTPARVRFCDVDPVSLNIDPARLAELITDRTRAIVLVHYGGWPAEMAEITALARPRGILVVEDCAHALGSGYHGRRPGSLGDIGCFSFHSSKNITTLGEGGMITFDRDDWAEWQALLSSDESASGEPPESALRFTMPHGYGTVSSALIALPQPNTGEQKPRFRYAQWQPVATPWADMSASGAGRPH